MAIIRRRIKWRDKEGRVDNHHSFRGAYLLWTNELINLLPVYYRMSDELQDWVGEQCKQGKTAKEVYVLMKKRGLYNILSDGSI